MTTPHKPGNRKYTQLSVDDVSLLRSTVFASSVDLSEWTRLFTACDELLERARATPEARICLAYAVKRGTGPRRVFKGVKGK